MSQDSSVSKGTAMAQFLAGAGIIIPFPIILVVTPVVTQQRLERLFPWG
jgi:hypothetical protein